MYKIKNFIDNFLRSGYTFDDFEYELKLKFALANSMLFVMQFFISLLAIVLYMNHQEQFSAFVSIYIMINFALVLFLRKRKQNYIKVVSLVTASSIAMVVIALIYYPDNLVRMSWFMVLIIISFFFGGKKLGFVAAISSMLAIVSLYFFGDLALTRYSLILIILIIAIGTIAVNLYEQRGLSARKRLYDLNQNLELRVKDEINKRITIYEESNLQIKRSAAELEQQKNAYKELAHHDMLTGLPNRVFFNEKMRDAIERHKSNKKQFAVLFLDLNNFKEINDSLGHHIGDEVLKHIAKKLSQESIFSDRLARFGGDEFVLLLEDIEDKSSIRAEVDKILEVISQPICINEHILYVAVSVGGSIYPSDATDLDTLLKYADAAMYSAKSDGVNVLHFYTKDMTIDSLERLELVNNIRQALNNDEFVVHYQPVFSSSKNRLVGMEALVRWQHPTRGLLSPKHFIDIAESSAIIVELGEQVLRKVALQVNAWHEKGFDPSFVSVNLSVKQLRHKSIVELVSDVLESVKCRSGWLELEITEGHIIEKPLEAIKVLNQIRELGVSLSVDDFGTGYSSLSYLKRLPVSKLKIDKSFIDCIHENSEDEALVTTIISMANNLSLDVVAEGVETKEQRIFLEEAGCDKIQGYYFARPMTAEMIEHNYLDKE